MNLVRRAVILALLAAAVGAQTTEPADKYLWLEEVSGDRSMAWVKAQNERSAKVLQADPRFGELQAAALKVLESPDRLATPDLVGNDVLNTWQDAEHVNGILRRTTLTDYQTEHPHWQTLLDYDALGKQDNEKWVAHGRVCLYPGDELCMVELSSGGEDASTLREFNLKTGRFVEGGFVLPRSKQQVSWLDKDTLLVTRDWGSGTMTKSGYPFVAKRWKRGDALDQATEIYRGTESDMSVNSAVLDDGNKNQAAFLFHGLNIFERDILLLTPEGPKRLGPIRRTTSFFFRLPAF